LNQRHGAYEFHGTPSSAYHFIPPTADLNLPSVVPFSPSPRRLIAPGLSSVLSSDHFPQSRLDALSMVSEAGLGDDGHSGATKLTSITIFRSVPFVVIHHTLLRAPRPDRPMTAPALLSHDRHGRDGRRYDDAVGSATFVRNRST
jgi:hypothetical protein